MSDFNANQIVKIIELNFIFENWVLETKKQGCTGERVVSIAQQQKLGKFHLYPLSFCLTNFGWTSPRGQSVPDETLRCVLFLGARAYRAEASIVWQFGVRSFTHVQETRSHNLHLRFLCFAEKNVLV